MSLNPPNDSVEIDGLDPKGTVVDADLIVLGDDEDTPQFKLKKLTAQTLKSYVLDQTDNIPFFSAVDGFNDLPKGQTSFYPISGSLGVGGIAATNIDTVKQLVPVDSTFRNFSINITANSPATSGNNVVQLIKNESTVLDTIFIPTGTGTGVITSPNVVNVLKNDTLAYRILIDGATDSIRIQGISITTDVVAGGGDISPLTTKGDLYGFSTVNDRLSSDAAVDGQVLTVDKSVALGLSYQTPTGGVGSASIATLELATEQTAIGRVLFANLTSFIGTGISDSNVAGVFKLSGGVFQLNSSLRISSAGGASSLDAQWRSSSSEGGTFDPIGTLSQAITIDNTVSDSSSLVTTAFVDARTQDVFVELFTVNPGGPGTPKIEPNGTWGQIFSIGSPGSLTEFTWGASDEDSPLITGILYTTEVAIETKAISNAVISVKNTPTNNAIQVNIIQEDIVDSNDFFAGGTIFTTFPEINLEKYSSLNSVPAVVKVAQTWDVGKRLQIILTINDLVNFAATGLKVSIF